MSGPEAPNVSHLGDDPKKWEAFLDDDIGNVEPSKEGSVEDTEIEKEKKLAEVKKKFMLYMMSRSEHLHGGHVHAREHLKLEATTYGLTSEDITAYLDDEYIEEIVTKIDEIEGTARMMIEKLRSNGSLPHEKRLLNLIANEISDSYPEFTKTELREILTPSVDMLKNRLLH